MTIPVQLYTVEEFERMAELPENADKRLEWIDGEVFEVVSSRKSSKIAGWISQALNNYIDEHNSGEATPPDAGYIIAGARLMPDVAYIINAHLLEADSDEDDDVYYAVCPDFAVEVISPSDLRNPTRRIHEKLKKYQEAKIRLLWLAYPKDKKVDVYINGEFSHTAGIDDTLDGSDVLPGFTLPVKRIFRQSAG